MKDYHKHPLYLLLCILGSLGFFVAGTFKIMESYYLQEYGLPAKATVINVYKNRSTTTILEYTTAEQQKMQVAVSVALYRPGDTLDIFYDVQKPKKVIINSFRFLWGTPFALYLGSLFLVGYVIIQNVKKKIIREL